jgi:hypothetical protein
MDEAEGIPSSVPFRKFDGEVLRTLRGFRPHPLPREAPRGPAEGPSPPGLDDQAADTAVSGGEALRSLHCAARSAVHVALRAAPRGVDLTAGGGLRPPASFKTSPLPRLDSLLGTLTRAGGGPPLPALRCAQRGASVATGCCARVRGGGGGRPRPFGMLLWHGREAARRDHRPQLVYELVTRETRGVAGKCLPDQSLGMAPVKAPRTRQFRGTGWPSEGQKCTLCPTGTRRERFPAGPLGAR